MFGLALDGLFSHTGGVLVCFELREVCVKVYGKILYAKKKFGN